MSRMLFDEEIKKFDIKDLLMYEEFCYNDDLNLDLIKHNKFNKYLIEQNAFVDLDNLDYIIDEMMEEENDK